jgi:hypothetical protein
MELIGLYLAGCALLVVAGAAKAVRPGDTARALATSVPLSVRALGGLVRGGAAVEAVLGAVALMFPRPLSASAVALSFAVFAVFVAWARVRGGAIASCGCFGTPDTPATALHVVVNVVLCLSAVGVAVGVAAGTGGGPAARAPTGSIASILSHQPLHGVPLVLASAAAAWLTFLAITGLARLQAARQLTAISFRDEK